MKAVVLICTLALSISCFAGNLPAGCEYDKECFFDAPGMKCADGTQSYFTITPRKNARNVLIYLHGGGACWNKASCEKGLAQPLTRVVANTDWNTGEGIFNRQEPKNPFREGYDIVTIPYCTGDVFTGNRTINYGTDSDPYVMQHYGFANVLIALAQVQKFYPFPEKVALVGESAGGMGTLYHAKSIDQFFPGAKKYVLDDCGVPFEPPYIAEKKYIEVMKNWGADNTFPYGKLESLRKNNFGTILDMNREYLPDTRFGLIGAYSDYVMTFFALSVGSQSAFTAVRNTLIHAADTHLKDSSISRVFYVNSQDHTYVHRSIGNINSDGANLGDWLTAMFTDQQNEWTNVRPDLHRPIQPVDSNDFYRAMDARGYNLEYLENLQ